MKIYTKTGDKGTTSLVGGTRVSKNDVRLNAYGTIDELNSFLGLLRAKTNDEKIKSILLDIQNTLFIVGANLASIKTDTENDSYLRLPEEKIGQLEALIDEIQQALPPLTNFIIYGDDEMSAICHCCRAVARRAEREIISVDQQVGADQPVIKYVNRLSDFLFVLARLYAKNAGGGEFFWTK